MPFKMTFPLLLMCCCSLLLLLGCAKSEVFTVGDDNLWRDGYAYEVWAQKYSFHVGDVLEFKYGITAHNVYEVTKATYQSCNASTGVLAKYTSGDDKIKLKEARPYWFLCDIEGHCLGGMRFGVIAGSVAPSPSQIANNAPPPPPPPPPSKASRGTIHATWALVLIVIINIMLRV